MGTQEGTNRRFFRPDESYERRHTSDEKDYVPGGMERDQGRDGVGQLVQTFSPSALYLRREDTGLQRKGKGRRSCDWTIDHTHLCLAQARCRNAQSSCSW